METSEERLVDSKLELAEMFGIDELLLLFSVDVRYLLRIRNLLLRLRLLSVCRVLRLGHVSGDRSLYRSGRRSRGRRPRGQSDSERKVSRILRNAIESLRILNHASADRSAVTGTGGKSLRERLIGAHLARSWFGGGCCHLSE